MRPGLRCCWPGSFRRRNELQLTNSLSKLTHSLSTRSSCVLRPAMNKAPDMPVAQSPFGHAFREEKGASSMAGAARRFAACRGKKMGHGSPSLGSAIWSRLIHASVISVHSSKAASACMGQAPAVSVTWFKGVTSMAGRPSGCHGQLSSGMRTQRWPGEICSQVKAPDVSRSSTTHHAG